MSSKPNDFCAECWFGDLCLVLENLDGLASDLDALCTLVRTWVMRNGSCDCGPAALVRQAKADVVESMYRLVGHDGG